MIDVEVAAGVEVEVVVAVPVVVVAEPPHADATNITTPHTALPRITRLLHVRVP